MSLKTNALRIVLFTGLLFGVSIYAVADKKADASSGTQQQDSTVSADQRKAMAEMHQKMADCLKTNKPIEECQNQMMQGCPHCKGMMGSHHHGMMGNGMGCCGGMGYWNSGANSGTSSQ